MLHSLVESIIITSHKHGVFVKVFIWGFSWYITIFM